MRRLLVAVSVLLVCSSARAQRAEDDGAQARMLSSVSAGVALALGSLAVGGTLLALEPSNAGRKPGAAIMVTGVALSPIASHALFGEWARAALFGVVPVAGAAGAVALIESAPLLQGHGSLAERRLLTACYCVTLLSAAIGLYDSMNAAERARERQGGIALSPWIERGGAGAVVGGVL
jgi:hypothetical protein